MASPDPPRPAVGDAGPGLARLQADVAAGLLDPARPPPAGVVAPGGGPVGKRFAVYRNTVVSGLVDALATTFPACVTLVGTAFFRAAAAVFVRRSPPRSALLLAYGAGFPAFLAGFPPAASIPYLADVAALEWAMTEAFHAADADPLPVAALGGVAPAALAGTRLRLHPSLRLLASRWPVMTVWADLTGDRAGGIDLDRGEEVLVVRPADRVEVTALPPGAAVFLAALGDGDGLGVAAARAVDAAASRGAGFELSEHLAGLFQAGCFQG